MDKNKIKDMLFAYVNEELTDEEKELVEASCRADKVLADELELTRATMRLIERRAPVEPKPNLWDTLSDRIDEEEAEKYAWVWTAKRLIPAMVAATLIISVLLSSATESVSTSELEYDTTILAYEGDQYNNEDNGRITDENILESVFFTTE